MIVTTQPHPIPVGLFPYAHVIQLDDEVNPAKWFNAGVTYARQQGATETFYMESDVRISAAGVFACRDWLRELNLSMTGPYFHKDPPGERIRIKTDNSWISPLERICQASMLPGESELLMDENLKWWYESDDLEYQARLDKGTGLVFGTGATHRGEIFFNMEEVHTAAAAAGREYFISKWGKSPFDKD